jgi:hypothetical protein
MAVARHGDKQGAKPISAWDIGEKLDGKQTKVRPARGAGRTASRSR